MRPYGEAFIDAADAVMKPPRWVVQDVLPVGMTIVGGPPKTAKTTFVLGMAARAAGYPVGILPPKWSSVEGGHSVVVEHEGDAGVVRQILNDGGITLRRDGGVLVAHAPDDFLLDDVDGMSDLFSWLEQIRPRVVVFDPLRDSHFQDENDSAQMIKILKPWQQWAVANSAAVIIVHHAAKMQDPTKVYDAGKLRGTGAIFGKADAVLMLSPHAREDHVWVEAKFKRHRGWGHLVQLSMPGWGWNKEACILPDPRLRRRRDEENEPETVP